MISEAKIIYYFFFFLPFFYALISTFKYFIENILKFDINYNTADEKREQKIHLIINLIAVTVLFLTGFGDFLIYIYDYYFTENTQAINIFKDKNYLIQLILALSPTLGIIFYAALLIFVSYFWDKNFKKIPINNKPSINYSEQNKEFPTLKKYFKKIKEKFLINIVVSILSYVFFLIIKSVFKLDFSIPEISIATLIFIIISILYKSE